MFSTFFCALAACSQLLILPQERHSDSNIKNPKLLGKKEEKIDKQTKKNEKVGKKQKNQDNLKRDEKMIKNM